MELSSRTQAFILHQLVPSKVAGVPVLFLSAQCSNEPFSDKPVHLSAFILQQSADHQCRIILPQKRERREERTTRPGSKGRVCGGTFLFNFFPVSKYLFVDIEEHFFVQIGLRCFSVTCVCTRGWHSHVHSVFREMPFHFNQTRSEIEEQGRLNARQCSTLMLFFFVDTYRNVCV